MTNEQILIKIIEKAVKNGWKPIKLKENETLGEVEADEWGVVFYTRKIGRAHV